MRKYSIEFETVQYVPLLLSFNTGNALVDMKYENHQF